MAMKPKADWIAVEGAFRSGTGSIRDIAASHGITDTAIRKRAKAEGWIRDPEGTKREQVKAIMSGVGSHQGSQFAAEIIAREAQQDAADMRLGLSVARKVLGRLETMAELCDTPKDVKVVAEANKIAIETIRRIRGLDEQAAPEIVIERSYGKANE